MFILFLQDVQIVKNIWYRTGIILTKNCSSFWTYFIKNAMYENNFNFLYQNIKSSWSSSIHFILNKLHLQHFTRVMIKIFGLQKNFVKFMNIKQLEKCTCWQRRKLINSEYMLFLKQDFVEKKLFCYPLFSCFKMLYQL